MWNFWLQCNGELASMAYDACSVYIVLQQPRHGWLNQFSHEGENRPQNICDDVHVIFNDTVCTCRYLFYVN